MRPEPYEEQPDIDELAECGTAYSDRREGERRDERDSHDR